MLETLRNIGNNKVFQFLLAIFLIIPFGLFGIDYYFKAPVGGDTVANVGGQRIGAAEFDDALKQQGELYRQQFKGSFDPALLDNPEIRRSVLDRLVADKLVVIGAERAGIRMGDAQLARRIAQEPFFQVDGKFSQRRYEDVARGMGLTTVGLDERLRQDYRQQDFRGAIAETAFVPRTTLDGFIRLSEQTREVSVVNVGPEAYLAKVKVSPEQVKAFYEANKARFTTPERARVEYVELSVDAIAAQAPVSAEDVKKLYDEGLQAGKWGQKEERRASHILLTAKPNATDADKKALQQKAEAIAAQVRKAPGTFAEVAKKESQDPGSAAQGGDLGFFARGAMVKAFEEAAFKAKKDEIVGPVQSDFGWHIIRVTDIKPEKVKSLADATPEIEAQLKKAAASRRFAEASEQFSNMVYEQSSSLKPAADALKLTVQQSPWLTKGAGGAPPLSNPKLMAEIFSDDSVKGKRNTSAIETSPGVLVSARVIEHKPAELRPLEEVRPAIEAQLQRDEALKLAKADGEEKLKVLQAGQDAGLKWPQVLAVNRQKPGGLFPQVIERVFRVDSRKLPAYVGVESPVGYTLVRVSKVIEPEKIEDAQRAALGTQLRQAVGVQELEAALGSLRGKVGVNFRKDALEKKQQPQG